MAFITAGLRRKQAGSCENSAISSLPGPASQYCFTVHITLPWSVLLGTHADHVVLCHLVSGTRELHAEHSVPWVLDWNHCSETWYCV